MKSFGPIYVQTMKYPHRFFWPLLEIGWTTETEEPYRYGHCVVLRVPFCKPAIAIGLWTTGENDEEVALLRAIQGRQVELEDIDLERF